MWKKSDTVDISLLFLAIQLGILSIYLRQKWNIMQFSFFPQFSSVKPPLIYLP